jgi:hydrophobe/amphiphile efflux-1 (HAE1) family protein
MSPASLSIKRPFFISCLVILMIVLGLMSLKGLPIDLFPDVSFPTVMIETAYPGAGPSEVETEVSKVIEDELTSISGIHKISSTSREGFSVVTAEFDLKMDIKYAEQQVRAKVDNVRRVLPDDIDQPVIRSISPSDAPIMELAFIADLDDGALFDLADDKIRPLLEQVNQVGRVDILGGRKREIHVVVDLDKARFYQLPASAVTTALKGAGKNVPGGKVDQGPSEKSFRTLAQFESLDAIKHYVVRMTGSERPVTVGDVANVVDTVEDETSRTWYDGKRALSFQIYRQNGANTVKVADDVKKRVEMMNERFKDLNGHPHITVVNDRSRIIENNVDDVYESIFIGIVLTVIVVYFFLGSFRSTIITGLALPNSLLGAFILMKWMGFSINIMSLLALSLVVGLLIDDAIVVRENIYRKIEDGMDAMKAALIGTNEVTLAVIATTLTVLAVFGPIGNLQGIIGQFFKQFGLTICFAMAISLFDALTIAPMLSAYFAGNPHAPKSKNKIAVLNERLLKSFDRFQTGLENGYEQLLRVTLKHPGKTIGAGFAVFVFCCLLLKGVPVTFLPAQDNGEFGIDFDLPQGASLNATQAIGEKIDKILHTMPEVAYTVRRAGNRQAQSFKGSLYVRLKTRKEGRTLNTTQVKDKVRANLKDFAQYNLKVADPDASGQNQRQFNLNIVGNDLAAVEKYADQVFQKIKTNPALKEVDTSFRTGKPEVQIKVNPARAVETGVSLQSLGFEIHNYIEGSTPATLLANGRDYDVRVRLQDDQRDLMANYNKVGVPNINNQLIPLHLIAQAQPAVGPSEILRENRAKYVQLSADITPGGPGLGGAMKEISKLLSSDLKPPLGVEFAFVGQAERFAELIVNIMVSLGLGVFFIYLVLASLYESFITPFTIMTVIPMAAAGAFAGLFISQTSLDLFSMIGCVTLMGLATKNSILIVDFVRERQHEGMPRYEALLAAGRARLRPILMTSFAMIAGMVPVAIGLNEASKQRTSLGIAIIGGTISSTLLALVMIPSVYWYVDRFETWFRAKFNRYVRGIETAPLKAASGE